ncbi:sigma-70 family RNA polymerase sigma factor [Streptomyces sp. WAC06614]|uniref:sigma-70 family RNA polymerase sigma factor n=1 Tax=Streptomyces sp. WAC06614 TaxID=2487416 RepID=UPI000F7AE8B9|nr:sigma-70 family RNA polymerase sigma factor [Streptomyces sp. WAC06614]RSS58237.1 sigma-70 family RNA polymerase sigma factor [Streptomyces sp. WAC06614]
MPYAADEIISELYRLHGGYLMRSLLKITSGDRGLAEDILQEAMTRAWQHPESLPAPDRLHDCRPWLSTVARRIAIDKHRRIVTRPREVWNEAPQEPIAPGDAYEDVLSFLDVEQLLNQLPPHHREVLVELYLNGRSMAQAAETLGIPVGTVKSRSFVAVRALRPMLEAAGMRIAA